MMRNRISFACVMTLAYLFAAGPASVLLHALDHAVDSYLSHTHDYGSESDNGHHDDDHNHQQIFSLQILPSAVPASVLRLAPPEYRSIQIALPAESVVGLLADVLQQRYRAADPPVLFSLTSFHSSLQNRAPPLA